MLTTLTPLRVIGAIAINTLREAIRNKVFGSLIFFSIVVFATGFVLGEMSLHQEARVAQNLTLATSLFFTALVTIYSSVSLLHREMERRTLYTILSKPIGRWQFLIGKYLGILALVVITIVILAAGSVVLITLQGGTLSITLLWAFYGVFLQMVILAALSILLASFSSPLLSGLISGALFIAGNLVSQLESVKTLLRQAQNPMAGLIDGLQLILPDLESLNLAYEVTYGYAIPTQYVFAAGWYASSYALMTLLLAIVIFSKRDFL